MLIPQVVRTISEAAAPSWNRPGGPKAASTSLSHLTIDPRRINVYERWTDEQALMRFRGSGPPDDQNNAIEDADVHEFRVEASGRSDPEPSRWGGPGVLTSRQGLDVPVLSNLPGYVPALLDTPAAPALVKNLYVVQSQVPFESEGLGLGHRETDQHGTFEPLGDDRNAGENPSQGRDAGAPGEASER